MQAFRRDTLTQFQSRMVSHLHAIWSGSDQELTVLVEDGVKQALGFDIRSEQDVQRYLEYMAYFGREFASLPWASTVLRDSDRTGTEKVDRLQWQVLHRIGDHSE